MTSQLSNVDILSAPLAAIDRRALSQAWYSALALARAPRRQDAGAAPQRSPVPVQAKRPQCAGDASGRVRAADRPARPAEVGAARAFGATVGERRAPRAALSARIERMLRRAPEAIKRGSFTTTCAGARVVIAVRARGHRLQVIALCPRRVRDTVARALAQARFALAARGMALDFVDGRSDACFSTQR